MKTRVPYVLWEESNVQRKPVYWLVGVRRRDAVSLIQARLWNWENSKSDEKGSGQVKKSKAAVVAM